MTNDEGTELLTQANALTTVPKIITVLAVGIIFDLLGRRFALFTLLIVVGASMAWLPYTSPDKSLFILAYVINGTAFNTIEASPLMMDYASRTSQGKMFGL